MNNKKESRDKILEKYYAMIDEGIEDPYIRETLKEGASVHLSEKSILAKIKMFKPLDERKKEIKKLNEGPSECPKCKSNNLAEFVYGLMTKEGAEEIKKINKTRKIYLTNPCLFQKCCTLDDLIVTIPITALFFLSFVVISCQALFPPFFEFLHR